MRWAMSFRFRHISLIWLILNGCHIHSVLCSLATWMYLGLVSSSAHNDQLLLSAPDPLIGSGLPGDPAKNSPVDSWCDSIAGLVDHQKALCRRYPDVFWQIKDAAQIAIRECQFQFRNERWNCTNTSDRRVFGKSVMKGNKETAFVTALSTAAVVHAVVKACSSGNLTSCGCDPRLQGQRHPNGSGWRWSGCSDNVGYGIRFSRQFNDAPEKIKHKDARGIRDAMHLHNKAAGRYAVDRLVKPLCRCHGVSGTCTMRTCWQSMAPFREVGAILKNEYNHAVRLAKKFPMKLKRRGKQSYKGLISPKELVFLERSPNYCNHDKILGILGTSGRSCNATSAGSDSCAVLCCGRGYNKIATRIQERCHCQFKWCCKVICKTCFRSVETYTCK